MKALVVGASGQVGSALMAALEQSGVASIGTHHSRSLNGTHALDARDAEAVDRCFEAARPDVAFLVVNTPGGVEFCEANPDDAYGLNVVGTMNVARSAARCGALLVYYSTDYIFDGTQGPYSEEDSPCPISVYGRTKWEAEQVVRSIVPQHLVLRTTVVFDWNRASRNFAMQVWEALSAGKTMHVASDQWGNPTLASYLAEVSVRLVQEGVTGVLNVVGKDRMPRSDLATALARGMGLDPALVIAEPTSALDQTANRPLQAGLTTDRLRRAVGTEPLDLTESIRRLRRQWRADTHVAVAAPPVSAEAARLKEEILAKVRSYHALAHAPRPFRPGKTRIQYSGRVYGDQEMVNLVDSALDFWLTLGPYGEVFERKLRRYLGARDFILVSSGSAANLAAVMSLMSAQLERPIAPGDEVITPALTFPTTLAPIVQCGLVPVLVDCEPATYNIDTVLMEAAVSGKTRAIMVPHTLGNPCDVDRIMDIAQRNDLAVIEDACDALGARFRGRLVGTFGDLATLSFYPAHQMTMGEGGGVIVNRSRLGRIVRSVRDWGRDCWCAAGESNSCGKRFGWQLGDLPSGYDHKYTYSNIGFNFKPTDLQAAIGVAQADRVDGFVAARRRNFARLYRGLERHQEHLLLPRWHAEAEPSWFGFPLTVRGGLERKRLVQWLESANIETRQVFGGNILKQPGYQNLRCRIAGTLEQTDRVMRDGFFIGVYPGLTDEMIDFVIGTFDNFFARNP